MRRTALFFAATLASSGALAEETQPPLGSGRPIAHGTFSHGDSSGFVEDMFGGAVERKQADRPGGTRKFDPAIRWEGPSSTRR